VLAVRELSPQSGRLAPGDPITLTATVDNVGEVLATVTTTLTIWDGFGNLVGWQEGSEFSVASGGSELLIRGWQGWLDEGTYHLELELWQGGQVVGEAGSQISVLAAAITDLTVPGALLLPGDTAVFTTTFENYLSSPISATASLAIYSQEGFLVSELAPQTTQVAGLGSAAFTWQWQLPGLAGGVYYARVVIRRENGPSYGPLVQGFWVGNQLFLPVVRRN